jgi:hypothetical protein
VPTCTILWQADGCRHLWVHGQRAHAPGGRWCRAPACAGAALGGGCGCEGAVPCTAALSYK